MIIDLNKKYLEESFNYLEHLYYFDESIEISADEINSIIESCNTISKQTLYESGIIFEAANFNSQLSKFGINESKVNSSGKEIVSIIKNEGLNSESKKKIHNVISELFEDIAKDISVEKILENGKLKDIERSKLKRSLILLLWVLLINSIAAIVLAILGPVGQFLTVSLVAPLVEESAKAISVKGNFEKEFWVVFNAFEFTSYIVKGGPIAVLSKVAGIDFGIKNLVRGRIAAVGMHTVNTLIHKLFDSEKFRKKFNIKDDKDAKDKSTFIGFVIAVLIHGTWNASAMLSPAFNSKVLGVSYKTASSLMER